MFVASDFVKQTHVQQRNLEAETQIWKLKSESKFEINSCSACFHLNFLSFHRGNCDGVAKDNSNQVFASSNL